MAKKIQTGTQKKTVTETKEQRFIRVVTPRVTKAVKMIKIIGNCAGSTYEYTPEQVEQIFVGLQTAMVELKGRFTAKRQAQPEFTFNS